MKRLFLMLSLLLTVVFSVQGAAAQVGAGEELTNAEDIEGLSAAYSRTYAVDYEALMASPSATGLDTAALMQSITIFAYVFDDNDAASDFFSDAKKQYEESLTESMEGLGEVTVSDLEGVDKDGLQVSIDMADLGMAMNVSVFIDGDTIFIVMVMDADVDAANETAVNVANYIAEADVDDEEVTFNEDGTSTGGVFDRFPESGSDEVNGLNVDSDSDLLAEGAA
ncbi:MAG: hypothetical protein KC435_06305 [Thermomicrobiales bacterium]|nr:hypothetical protein [Thermomicrobiales bacterium]